MDGTGCTEPACDTEAREDEAAGLVEFNSEYAMSMILNAKQVEKR